MAAPSSTKWGKTVGSGNKKGRIGVYLGVSSSATQTKINVEVWFWSKYTVSDTSNSYYYNNNATSATTKIGSVSIHHTVSSGAGWSTKNQTKLGETTYTYARGTSSVTRNVAAKLTGVEAVGGGTMTVTSSYTVPALSKYTVSYNANGGSGAPGSQTKYYGKTLKLSTTKPKRTGYNFLGWSTSSSGSVKYAPGASYTSNASVTLYAVWERITFSVSFDAGANGGTVGEGEVENISVTYSYNQALGELPIAKKRNYKFLGWNTSEDGSGLYVDSTTTVTSAVTYYAIFELQANCYIRTDGAYKAGMMYTKIDGTYKTGTVSVKDEGTYKGTNM